MAINDTFRTYMGDGTTTSFAIPFSYEQPSEVLVTRKNGTVSYTFINHQLIQLSEPIAVGDALTIQRVTNIDSPAVTWKNGSGTTGTQLNAMARQLLNAMQEARDTAARGLFRLPSGEYDFANAKGRNIADPVEDTDVVNKRWAESSMTSQVAQAIVARQGAEEARNVASQKAGQTSADAASTYIDRMDVVTKHGEVVTKHADVVTKHGEVVSKAAQVATDAAAVVAINVPYLTTVKQDAEAARDSALAWANGAVNTQITPGNYSAKHWASVAQAVAQSNATGIGFTPAGNIAATNVQSAIQELDAEKAPLSHNHDTSYYTKSQVDTALAAKAALSHTHAIADITNLQATLNGKAASSHTHAIADVTNLQTALDGKAAVDHTHGNAYVQRGWNAANAILIGWDGSAVQLQVDSTYQGKVLHTGNFAANFALRRVDAGEVVKALTGVAYTSPAGSFVGDLRIYNSAGVFYTRSYYLQWYWNGTWYGTGS